MEDLLAQKKDLKYKADKLSIFILEKMLSDRRTDIGHGALKDYQDFVAKGPSTMHVISGDGQIDSLSGNVYVSDGDQTEKVPTEVTKYVINGKGWGHGLGMSQWGAKNMADQGFDFDQILTFYYTDTHIE